jgi:hypothetical protein
MTKDEMLTIEGVNPSMVRQFGQKVIQLLKNTKSACAADAAQRNMLQRQTQPTFKPHDPNHETVIDLTEDIDEMEEDLELSDDDGTLEQSHFFSRSYDMPPEALVERDADVQRFNQRFNSTSQGAPAQLQTRPQRKSSTYQKSPWKGNDGGSSQLGRKASGGTYGGTQVKSLGGDRPGDASGSGFMRGIRPMA